MPTAARRIVRGLLPGSDTPLVLGIVAALAATRLSTAAWHADIDLSRWASTNLINLHHHPFSAMLASIFVVGVWSPVTGLTVIAATVLERRVGGWRTAGIGLLGHVVATLVTEGAVGVAILLHREPRSTAWRLDVGISYVAFTLAVAAVRFAPRPWRWSLVGVLFAYVAVPVVLHPDMTGWGHVMSGSIGLAMWHWLPASTRTSSDRARTASRQRLGIASAATIAALALAGAAAVGISPVLRPAAAPRVAAAGSAPTSASGTLRRPSATLLPRHHRRSRVIRSAQPRGGRILAAGTKRAHPHAAA